MAGKVVVITGATRGLGAAMASELARLGHCIVGCGRSGEIIERMTEQFGKEHDFTTLDITDADAVTRWGKLAIARLGPPDLLLNNAALINSNRVLWEISAQEFDAVVDVNIKGVANVIRSFVPAMVERGTGVIVNFSSGWGRSTSSEVAPYCATKFAIEGLTKALAQELPASMAAIPLNPGIINTDMLQSCFGSGARSYPTPSQWAKSAVPFLLQLGAKDNGKSLSAPGA
jgi:NAD(P)-dependent dehydrogenase (short-subunit alcohol dehydrogenase family)